jgi:hypothetical protein
MPSMVTFAPEINLEMIVYPAPAILLRDCDYLQKAE